jgi:hypothetical protein
MPNWCENVLVVGHADPNMVERFLKGYESGDLGQEFVPMPAEYLEDQRWYDWRVDQWGTKWKFGQGDYGRAPVQREGKVEVRFDTAWSPPHGLYLELRRLGFDIDASCYEPGVAFCGRVLGDECTSYGIDCWNPECVRRFIDRDLVDLFSIDDGCLYDEESCEHDETPWFDVHSLEHVVASCRAAREFISGKSADRPES